MGGLVAFLFKDSSHSKLKVVLVTGELVNFGYERQELKRRIYDSWDVDF